MATTVGQPAVVDDVTEEQVKSFRRDGFLIIEEGLLSIAAVEVWHSRRGVVPSRWAVDTT